MVLLYMVTWIPSIYTPVMLAYIYQHHGSVMGINNNDNDNDRKIMLIFDDNYKRIVVTSLFIVVNDNNDSYSN